MKASVDTVIPAANTRSFGVNRVARTLHGVWRGEVVGDVGEVNIDYFWIMDTKANEGLIIAQRSGRSTVGLPRLTALANAPKLSYLMCDHAGYTPGVSKPQIHVFTKVSNSTANAAQIIEKATGVKSSLAQPTLTDLWNGLVSTGYFNDLRYVAYAGGLFKPLQIKETPSAFGGAPEVNVRWDAQYRGGGSTQLKYTSGIPMVGVEQARFVGTTSTSGDYLVSSPGNGAIWRVELIAGGEYDLAFDQVSLGPLQ
jgi:hypothetical protein